MDPNLISEDEEEAAEDEPKKKRERKRKSVNRRRNPSREESLSGKSQPTHKYRRKQRNKDWRERLPDRAVATSAAIAEATKVAEEMLEKSSPGINGKRKAREILVEKSEREKNERSHIDAVGQQTILSAKKEDRECEERKTLSPILRRRPSSASLELVRRRTCDEVVGKGKAQAVEGLKAAKPSSTLKKQSELVPDAVEASPPPEILSSMEIPATTPYTPYRSPSLSPDLLTQPPKQKVSRWQHAHGVKLPVSTPPGMTSMELSPRRRKRVHLGHQKKAGGRRMKRSEKQEPKRYRKPKVQGKREKRRSKKNARRSLKPTSRLGRRYGRAARESGGTHPAGRLERQRKDKGQRIDFPEVSDPYQQLTDSRGSLPKGRVTTCETSLGLEWSESEESEPSH